MTTPYRDFENYPGIVSLICLTSDSLTLIDLPKYLGGGAQGVNKPFIIAYTPLQSEKSKLYSRIENQRSPGAHKLHVGDFRLPDDRLPTAHLENT